MPKFRLIAVGSRMPRWVREAYEDYTARLAAGLKLSLTEVEPGARRAGQSPERAIATEAKRILALLRSQDFVVALDEKGPEMSTRALASWLSTRLGEGKDVVFLIGGPDGLGHTVLERADVRWSLSRLTFPHALVRVVLAEQLYRAHAVLANHPYHRE